MNVSLTPELEAFVHQKVESGFYNSASEVIREALRLLDKADNDQASKLEDLRREIQKGIDQIKSGDYIELQSDEELREFFEDIKRRGRERLKTAGK